MTKRPNRPSTLCFHKQVTFVNIFFTLNMELLKIYFVFHLVKPGFDQVRWWYAFTYSALCVPDVVVVVG